MSKPPTFERYTQIEAQFRDRQQGDLSRAGIWGLVGELLQIVQTMAMEEAMNARRPQKIEGPSSITLPDGVRYPEKTQQRPTKPHTPGPSEWKRMTAEQQSAHFAAIQAYEASLTPEDIAAILAAENEAERAHRTNYSGWKDQFAADAPYVPNR